MSSELEEFIGFATRVIVFRHGTVFDEFVGEDIDPTRILEAMFGHTRPGCGAAAHGDAADMPGGIDGGLAAARRDREWSRPSGPVDNPLRAARPPLGSPVRSGNPAPSATIAKPPNPEVTNIRIVRFDDDRTQTVEPRNALPFRRPERSP